MNCRCKAFSSALQKLSLKPGDSLQSYHDAVVKAIEKTYGLKTTRIKLNGACDLMDPLTFKPLMKIAASEEVLELPEEVFSRSMADYEDGTCGSYNVGNRRIFLNDDQWCFSSLIHEVLHSRSVFSKKEYSNNLEFVCEGLTELLVGLTLKEALPECYEQWQTIDNCFHNHYEESVKLWYYLAHKIDFNPIIKFYFKVSETKPLLGLGALLEAACDHGCADLFASYTPDRDEFILDFWDIMSSVFPGKFAEFMQTDLRESIILTTL